MLLSTEIYNVLDKVDPLFGEAHNLAYFIVADDNLYVDKHRHKVCDHLFLGNHDHKVGDPFVGGDNHRHNHVGRGNLGSPLPPPFPSISIVNELKGVGPCVSNSWYCE